MFVKETSSPWYKKSNSMRFVCYRTYRVPFMSFTSTLFINASFTTCIFYLVTNKRIVFFTLHVLLKLLSYVPDLNLYTCLSSSFFLYFIKVLFRTLWLSLNWLSDSINLEKLWYINGSDTEWVYLCGLVLKFWYPYHFTSSFCFRLYLRTLQDISS